MRILVTGGAGFIGSVTVKQLIDEGHEITILDNLSTGFEKNVNAQADFLKGDITDPYLKDVVRERSFEIVYHLAAQVDVRKSMEDPIFDAQQNLVGTLNLLELVKDLEINKIIFSSTGGAIYGDTDLRPTLETHPEGPTSHYGLNKLIVDRQVLPYYNNTHGINFVSLRYSNVYGPRQNPHGEAGVVAIFLNRILKDEQPVINGDGLQTRDYVYVGDIVKANVLALNLPQGIYNVGTGIETNVGELFDKLNSFFDYRFERKHGPAKIGEQKTSCLNCDKIRGHGWEPEVSLEEGLKRTYEYFLNN